MDIVEKLRNRRAMINRGNGDVIDVPDDDCEEAANEIERMRAALSSPAPAGGEVPADVAELVIAARIVAFEDQSPEALRALDKASEAFAERVPWENDPDEEQANARAADIASTVTPPPSPDVARVVEALTPFAMFARLVDHRATDDTPFYTIDKMAGSVTITHGDFRRARTALTPQMSTTTGDLIRQARREAFKEAAAIAGKCGGQIMRIAEKHHRREEYDAYEALECQATVASHIEGKLLRRAKRP